MLLPGEFSPFIEKKVVFCLVVGGLPPSPLLVVGPLKKTLFFMCVFPYSSYADTIAIQPVGHGGYLRIQAPISFGA